jgi:hypothetical protein
MACDLTFGVRSRTVLVFQRLVCSQCSDFNDFNLTTIGEFYAATEGNANMINMLGEPGAVGFVPPMMSSMYPVKIVRYDVEKDEIVRRLGGLCVEADYGEPGELIGRIDTNDPLRSYAQYQDKSATEKKILRNVFTHGDAYFRTGDLLKRDPVRTCSP